MLSKSRQLILLEIDKKGSLKSSDQTVYNADSAFFTTTGYLRQNGLIDYNPVPQDGKRYIHDYYLTEKGKIVVVILKSLNSSDGYHNPNIDVFGEINKIVGGS